MGAPGCRMAQAAPADHVVINEVFIDSLAGTGGTDDDWVELYNPTGEAVALAGWSIQKFSSTGSTGYNQPLTGAIPAGGYFLIVRNAAATSQALKDEADLLADDSFSLANNNMIYLSNSAGAIIPGTNDPSIIDLVGFGTASYFEGAAAAPGISETRSISRQPEGEDTDQNSQDLVLFTAPTPTNSSAGDDDVSGTVLLTITPGSVPVRNITPISAEFVFSANADGVAQIKYGLTAAYNNSTAEEAVIANTESSIYLAGLECGQIYHYAIYAETADGSETDTTADATFATLPCGIAVDSLTMTRTAAKANNKFADGWEWQFNITVWDLSETSLFMKFNQWSGPAVLNAGGNMEYSVDDGAVWRALDANNTYPGAALAIGSIDLSASAGRQVRIIVRMKVPVGTKAGTYSSSYGILTE